MARNQSFNISLKLIKTQFDKGIKNVQKQLRSFGSFVKGAFAIGTVTAFGRKMVEVGSEFENAMARVKAVTNASAKEFKMMQKEAQRLGETTRYTASEAAAALETLTRNGMSATQATQALSGVLQLAQANSIELAQAADIVTNSLNMFGLSVSETTRVNDVLSSTAANSATDINLLYEALVNAAPAAHTLGFSIEETSAALGALANQGVKGANAGTAIRTALTKMADPKIIKKMKEMGVAIDEQTMKEEGLLGTVNRLKEAQLSLSDLVSIFSQRGAVGIQQLIGAYDDFEYMLNVTQNSAGTTARMFEQGVGSVKKEIDTLKSAYEGFLITLSQKTGGAVKGVIRLLQNLVGNFKTVAGTIMNVASVVIPLLSKQVTNLVKVTRAGLKAVKADAAAVATMMGNWIGLIATAVTWIGTALYGAWNRANGAIRDAKKEINETNVEIEKMRGKTETLVSILSKDKESLNNVVETACELFPEFKDAIHDAAVEASKTGNYDKLIDKLREITELQAVMMGNATAQKAYEANISAGGSKIRRASNKQIDAAGLGQLRNYFKNNSKQYSKDLQDAIYGTVLDMFIKGSGTKAINDYISSVTGGQAALEGNGLNYIQIDGLKQFVQFGRKLNEQMNENAEIIHAANEAAKQEAEERAAEQDRLANEAAAAEERANKAKAKRDKVEEIETDLKKELNNITDDLAHGFTDAKTAVEQVTKAYKKAYEDLRNETGKTGEDNPYFKRYKDANAGVLPDLTSKYGKITSPIDYNTPLANKSLAGGIGLPNTANNDDSFNLQGTIDELNIITDQLGAMDSISRNIASAFSTLNDEGASFQDKLSAVTTIMQTIPGILQTINNLMTLQNSLEELHTRLAGEGANKTLLQAIASMFAGNGKIPIVGIAMATAGVAALVAAMKTAPKFAEGGIVGGNSFSGDKNFARVNSGEMILNGGQQARLFEMLNGNSTGATHNVNFVIKGKDLYGTLKNYTDAAAKIKGNI